MKKKNIYIN